MEIIQKKVPYLRFSDSLTDWKSLKYDDIFSFYTTNSFSRDMLNYEVGEVKNIHYGDIHTKFSVLFDISKENVPYVNEEIDITKIKDTNYCKVGDLVIADASEDYNDVGKTIEIINLDNKKVIAGLHTFLARPKKNLVALGFTGYLLQSWNVRKQVMTIAQGSKVLSLSYNRLGKIDLLIPSIPEQQKIAKFLTSVDTKINQLSRKKELLEEYKKGVMQQLFSQKINFKDDNGNFYPNWVNISLSKLCDYKNGGSFENYVTDDGLYNLITLNSIDINGNIKKQHKKVSITDNSLNKGDLVMVLSDVAHGNFLGLTDIIPEDNFVLNQRMGALKPISDFNSYYLKTYINFNQKYFKLKGQGSSQQNLSKGDITNFKVNLPCMAEQNKIANFLSAIDDKIGYAALLLEKTKQFKKGLLQKMFV